MSDENNRYDDYHILSELNRLNEKITNPIFSAIKTQWNFDDKTILIVTLGANQDFELTNEILDLHDAQEMTFEDAFNEIDYQGGSENPFNENELSEDYFNMLNRILK